MPVDGTIYLGVQSYDRGWLWIDDRLVWQSGQDYNPEENSIIPVELKAGTHKIILRCSNDYYRGANEHFGHLAYFENFAASGITFPQKALDFTKWNLAVCLAGNPQGHEAPISMGPGVPEVSAARHNGTGLQEGSAPPFAWDSKKNINVAWQLSLPLGGSEPIAVGDALVVMAEPNQVYCLDQASGAIRWHANVGEAPSPAPKIERAPENILTHTATAVPVSDGTTVYVTTGTGIVAAYDLQGNLQWSHDTKQPWRDPVISSPVLIGDKLIVQTPPQRRKKPIAMTTVCWL